MSQVNITLNTNTVDINTTNNQIVVTDPTNPTTVNITQPVTSVVEVITAGPQGPQGPIGPGANINTGSFVTTSSFNAFTSSYNTGSFTGSFIGSLFGTSSWATNALTASYLLGYVSPFPFTGSALISGSLGVTGPALIGTGSSLAIPTYGLAPNLSIGMNTGSTGAVLDLRNTSEDIQTGETLGVIQFVGKDDSNNGYASSQIRATVASSPGTGNSGGGNIAMWTAEVGTGLRPIERMRVNSNGQVLIGLTSSLDTTSKLIVNGSTVLTGSLIVTQGITGSLLGTASFASTASFSPLYLPLAGGTLSGPLTASNGIISNGIITNGMRIKWSSEPDIDDGKIFRYFDSLIITNGTGFNPNSKNIILGGGPDSVYNDVTIGKGNFYVSSGSANITGNITSTGDLSLYGNDNRTLTLQATAFGGTEIKLLPNTTVGYARINVGNTNQPLDFQMNSVDVMRIAQDGKVGIGTTSSNALLDVNGDALINGLTVGKGSGFTGFTLFNTALGVSASYSNQYGLDNTTIGYLAYKDGTNGSQNTAIGSNAMRNSSFGSSNTAVGYYALSNATGLNSSIGIGANTQTLNTDDSNSIIIGANAVGLGSNTVVLGDDNITTTALKGNVGIGATTLTAKLHVRGAGATSATTNLRLQNSSLTDLLVVKDDGSTTLSGSLIVTQGISGSFSGSGANLFGIPASGITGLNLSQITTGSVTASVSPSQFTVRSGSVVEFQVTGTGITLGNISTDTHRVTGSLNISGSVTINNVDIQSTIVAMAIALG